MPETLLTSPKKYEEVAAKIEELLLKENLEPGSRLPAEVKLSKLFKVAPMTISHSLQLLSKKGVIKRIRRKGTFLKRRPTLKNDTKLQKENPVVSDNTEESLKLLGKLEEGNLFQSIFTSVKKEINVCAPIQAAPRNKFWHNLVDHAQKEMPGTKINLVDEVDFKKKDPGDIHSVDVMPMDIANMGTFRAQGTLSSLPICKFNENFQEELYFPGTWEILPDETINTVPFTITLALTLINKNLAKKYQLPLTDAVSIRKLDEIYKVNQTDKKDFPLVGSFIHLPIMLMLSDNFSENADDSRTKLEDFDYQTFLNFNKAMYKKFIGLQGQVNMFKPDCFWQLFIQEELLSLSTFSYAMSFFDLKKTFPMHLKPLIIGENFTVSLPIHYGVSSQSTEPERAWDFLRLINGLLGQDLLVEHNYGIPAMIGPTRTYKKRLDTCSGFDDIINSLLKYPSTYHHLFQKKIYINLSKINHMVIDYYQDRISLGDMLVEFKETTQRILTGLQKMNEEGEKKK